MMAVVLRESFLILFVVCLAFCNSTEAADAEVSPRGAPADAQDLIVLGPLRPLLVRLHVTVDGRPFREEWDRRFDELFAELDHDGDGRLSVAQGDDVARHMSGSLRDAPRSIAKDSALASAADENGTVDRRTLAAYIQKILPTFGLRARPVISQSAGRALLPLLDTNVDQQLSADELARAEEQLMQRDFNDDGVITRFELILDPAAQSTASAAGSPTEKDSPSAPVLLIDAAATADSVADRLLKRYDRNDDGRVLTDGKDREISLPAALLGRLDQNSDAALERGELLAFLDRPPDLELTLAMGPTTTADRRSRARVRVEPDWRVRATPDGGYKLKLGELDINFVRLNRDPRQADFYDFNAMDADKNGYLEQREADAANIGRGSFEAMDADGDKKVFKGEFSTFAEEQKAAAAVRLQLEVSDMGQDLFNMLDTDLDGVLSSRELRSATNILALEDKNGDGVLGGDEIPQRMSFEIVRGAEAPSDTEARVARGNATRSAAKANTTGPRWFRKMDRNNDGDLSVREFVGPLEAFRKLDADGDGLIDREEAEAVSPPGKQED
ncbi:MAG TPA: hypothetical protein VL175_06980 [Pirellulales bacterium]|jgi:Ca2+-binding EF-hand superfamily protein|nr:hypothetical protein [Pirellulales bacterium]